jgi:hypothetical protein
METPKFDPTKPFEVEDSTPTFDPSQPFEEMSDEPLMSQEAPIDPVQENLEAKLGFIAGKTGAEAVGSGISSAANAGIQRIGKLTPQELDMISQNATQYKKSRGMEDLLEQFRGLADTNRQNAFTFAEQAKESLKGLGPIKGQDLISSISNVSSAPLVDLPEDVLPQPKVNTSNVQRLENLSKAKDDVSVKLKAMIDSGIESREINNEIQTLQNQLSNIDNEINKASSGALKDIQNPIKPSLKEFSEVTNFPEEVLSANPDLMNKRIAPSFGNVLKNEVDFLNQGELSAYDVGKKYIQKLQDSATYNPLGPVDETAKFKQEISRNVSEFLKSQPGAEEYKKGQELSKKAIELQDGLKEFGIKLDSDGEYKISSASKIQKIYKDGNQKEIDRLQRLITEAQELGIDKTSGIGQEQLKTIDRFQDELPLSSIKKRVSDIQDSRLAQVARSAVGGSLGGVPGAVAGAVAPTGTKLQELAALLKGSQAFKTATKGAKVLGPLAGLAVAGMSYDSAKDQGLSDLESVGTTAGEVLNPIPFTDVTGAYVEGKKELEKTGDIGEALSKSGQAFIKPAREVYNAPSNLPSSQRIREMETGRSLSPSKKPEEVLQSGKLETTDGPELTAISRQLESMTDNKAAQEYARVLNSIISSPSKNKEAQISVLNQQPAFRELMRKTKGEQK